MPKIFNGTPAEVLLVEDNPADAHLTMTVLEDKSININVNLVNDGIEALSYLRKQKLYINSPRPDLIILDLNMPRKGGHEVLQELKDDQDLRNIPVVVLTTSSEDNDIAKSYNLHANCFITKSIDFNDFERDIESIKSILV